MSSFLSWGRKAGLPEREERRRKGRGGRGGLVQTCALKPFAHPSQLARTEEAAAGQRRRLELSGKTDPALALRLVPAQARLIRPRWLLRLAAFASLGAASFAPSPRS